MFAIAFDLVVADTAQHHAFRVEQWSDLTRLVKDK
jgi:virulence-associated protein VapD